MSRHSSAKVGPEIFFFMSTIILGAIFPLFWLWFLPRYSVAFNILATKSGITPFNSLVLIEFLLWPIVMIIYFRARM